MACISSIVRWVVPYEIVYKGHLSAVGFSEFDKTGINLPWDTEVLISQDAERTYLSFCTVLIGLESAVRDALCRFLQTFPEATGAVMCYGDNPHDIRRILVRDGRIYEQKGSVSYEEPGKVIWIIY